MSLPEKADVLLGLQWGDEGKGKIVDVLSPGYKIIARFQGGPNAGHTIEFDKKKFVLHTIPSGIFHEDCTNIVGNGVVIDPLTFSKEIESLELDISRVRKSLFISDKAHLILPSHRILDAAYEKKKGNAKIGSTLKGIGPAYTDKIARCGIRIGDTRLANFREKYDQLKTTHLDLAKNIGFELDGFALDGLEFGEYEKKWFEGLDLIGSLRQMETEVFLNSSLDQGVKVLAEGAQGTLLDVEFGSYPFVTSSNTIAAGACSGLGLPPSRIGEVFGIFKAYCTRVGSGPFPTELTDKKGDLLRETGNEFGSTTGRPRRCGWLDLPALKYSVMINGVSRLIITKIDVLSIMKTFKVCTAYEYEGKTITHFPSVFDSAKLRPVLTEMKGWHCDLSGIKSARDLPAELHDFLGMVQDYVKVPIIIVSTGPDRNQTVYYTPFI
jgi:adenylosuccinate synthase